MKKALVRSDMTTIFQIVDVGEEFSVAPPMEWVNVADDTVDRKDTWVNGAVIKYVPPVVPPPTKITFDDFEVRFTTAEWDDMTDFVYQTDTATGVPKRRALIQGLARVQSRNKVNLRDVKTAAFLDILVSGGVITQARRDIVLTP